VGCFYIVLSIILCYISC